MVFYRLAHGAAGLVRVGAVAKAAIGRETEYLTEIMAYLLRLHVEGAEAFDARRVDDPAASGQPQHLAEGGGVGARVVRIRNLGGAQVHAGNETVEQG